MTGGFMTGGLVTTQTIHAFYTVPLKLPNFEFIVLVLDRMSTTSIAQ